MIGKSIQDFQYKKEIMQWLKTHRIQIDHQIYTTEKGVPQGSKLGPALYNLATSHVL
jgi:retron-type reverse transcriptase